MTITKEISLKDFEFWGYARENVKKLTTEELDMLEDYFSDEGSFNETELNDIFAFDFENVCDILGLTEEEVLARE